MHGLKISEVQLHNHLISGIYPTTPPPKPNNDTSTCFLIFKSHSISVHCLFFASFCLQNLSPAHVIALKKYSFFNLPCNCPLKIATNNCILLLNST